MQTWMNNIVIFMSVYLYTQMLDRKEQSQWRFVFRKESHVSSKERVMQKTQKMSPVDPFDNWYHY